MFHGLLSKIFKVREKVARDLSGQQTRRRRKEDPDWSPDEHYDDEEKPFLEHLEDLRSMLVGMVATLLVATVVCFAFHKQLTDILRFPLERAGLEHLLNEAVKAEGESGQDHAPGSESGESGEVTGDESVAVSTIGPGRYTVGGAPPESGVGKGALHYDTTINQLKVFDGVEWNRVGSGAAGHFGLTTVDVTGVFMMSIKVSLFSAIVVSFPLLLYFLLQFVLPGLKRKEKRVLWPSLAVGFGLFVMGVVFAYLLVLPRALEFFYMWAQRQGVETIWTIERYVTFATRFLLVFGISFELPVLVMALVKIDLLNYSIMKGTRRHAIVAILVFAAIVTPTTDPGTLLLLSVPMCLLYEICIWIAYFMEQRDRERYPELYEAWDQSHEDEEKDPWESDLTDNEEVKNNKKEAPRSSDVAVTAANPVAYGGDFSAGEDAGAEEETEPTLEEIARMEEQDFDFPYHDYPRFTEAQLMRKTKAELFEIAEHLGCAVDGPKAELVRMILGHQ
jgi:Tat protein translocase TatC